MKAVKLVLAFVFIFSSIFAAEGAPPAEKKKEPPKVEKGTSLGKGAKAWGGGSVAVGDKAEVARSETGGVAIGVGAKAVPDMGVGGGGNVAIGQGAIAHGWRDVTVGAFSEAGKVSGVALGYGAKAMYPHGLCLGRGTFDTAGNETVIGSASNRHVYFAIGHSHRFPDPPSMKGTIDRKPNKHPIYIHGPDAKDRRDGTDINIAGGDLNICAGRGTGTGISGKVNLMTAPAAPGIGPNQKNKLTPALSVDDNKTKGETRLLLYDTKAKSIERVVVHEIEVGGKKMRVLGFAE
ncbi:MAG: hypothetical protein ACYTFY_12490 [Planctomycetota bacterium]|jgi:hypothetical protein